MSLKRLYFNQGIECCRTCKFIDEYAFDVNNDGTEPQGYDGTAVCCLFDDEQKETDENRLFISPVWSPCKKYKRCTERQADYLDVFDSKSKTIIENPNDTSKIERNHN